MAAATLDRSNRGLCKAALKVVYAAPLGRSQAPRESSWSTGPSGHPTTGWVPVPGCKAPGASQHGGPKVLPSLWHWFVLISCTWSPLLCKGCLLAPLARDLMKSRGGLGRLLQANVLTLEWDQCHL